MRCGLKFVEMDVLPQDGIKTAERLIGDTYGLVALITVEENGPSYGGLSLMLAEMRGARVRQIIHDFTHYNPKQEEVDPNDPEYGGFECTVPRPDVPQTLRQKMDEAQAASIAFGLESRYVVDQAQLESLQAGMRTLQERRGPISGLRVRDIFSSIDQAVESYISPARTRESARA